VAFVPDIDDCTWRHPRQYLRFASSNQQQEQFYRLFGVFRGSLIGFLALVGPVR